MAAVGRNIAAAYGVAVLMKGGHHVNDANDLLIQLVPSVSGKKDAESSEMQYIETWFRGTRIDNPNTHGTGCTLSSAIASNLAMGSSLQDAVKRAKNYLTGALAAGLDLGAGSGPMDHGYLITEPMDELLYV